MRLPYISLKIPVEFSVSNIFIDCEKFFSILTSASFNKPCNNLPWPDSGSITLYILPVTFVNNHNVIADIFNQLVKIITYEIVIIFAAKFSDEFRYR